MILKCTFRHISRLQLIALQGVPLQQYWQGDQEDGHGHR